MYTLLLIHVSVAVQHECVSVTDGWVRWSDDLVSNLVWVAFSLRAHNY